MKSHYLIILSLVVILLVGCNNSGQSSGSANRGMAASALAGSVLKSKDHPSPNSKYKRKDCPVCKGKGWYMSGDGIQKIECQYCEPETEPKPEKPPVIIKR